MKLSNASFLKLLKAAKSTTTESYETAKSPLQLRKDCPGETFPDVYAWLNKRFLTLQKTRKWGQDVEIAAPEKATYG